MTEKEINIFNFLELRNNENIYSQFIASILKHDKKYLVSFLQAIGVDKGYINVDDCTICTENYLKERNSNKKYGRADIWIGDNNENARKKRNRVIIENKLYASDQWAQLSRYHAYLNEAGAKREGKIFYLSIHGSCSSGQSSRSSFGNYSVKYNRLSYGREILKWLRSVNSSDPTLHNMVSNFIDLIESETKEYQLFKRGDTIQSFLDQRIITSMSLSVFKSIMELYFWNYLSDKLQDAKEFKIDYRRAYSWDKIFRKFKKKRVERDYGLVILRKDYNDKIRLQTDLNGKIQISIGRFNEENNKWIVLNDLKDEAIIDINLNDIESKGNIDDWFEHNFEPFRTMILNEFK